MTAKEECQYWIGQILEKRLLSAIIFAPIHNFQRDKTYGPDYYLFKATLNKANSGQLCPDKAERQL